MHLLCVGAAPYHLLSGNVAGLRQTVTRIKFRWVYEERDIIRQDYSQALVWVEECPGWHFFDVRATADRCESLPHYGTAPNYLFYRSGNNGC